MIASLEARQERIQFNFTHYSLFAVHIHYLYQILIIVLAVLLLSVFYYKKMKTGHFEKFSLPLTE